MLVNKTPGLTSIAWMTIIEADLYNIASNPNYCSQFMYYCSQIEPEYYLGWFNAYWTYSPHFQNIYPFIVADAGIIVAGVWIVEADSMCIEPIHHTCKIFILLL